MSPTSTRLDESAFVKKLSAKVDRKERAKGERLRAEFVARADLQPPDVLRLIDIQATCQARLVLLRSYMEVLQLHADDYLSGSSELGVDYSAISHTFGMEVYSIFDCKCASTLSLTANVPPRCWDKPCPHFNGKDDKHDVRNRIVNDILEMCYILSRAGVRYAWHDGVCIAQYNEKELTATIKSIGWIYASAKDTIVFLHYIGKPMAPIAPRGCGYELACRWHTRVWTFQEAALSKSRRYCVRVCKRSLHFNRLSGNCDTLKDFEKKAKKFEQKASQWYEKSTSEIDVITEERFLEIIYDALDPLQDLWDAIRTFKAMLEEVKIQNGAVSQQLAASVNSWYLYIQTWFECLEDLRDTLIRTCLRFPELGTALVQCSMRDSKHTGDRINSVLTLAGLKDLVAPKDFDKAGDSMEAWTLKFFEKQGQWGLAWAVLSGNKGLAESEDLHKITHSWVPLLWKPLSGPKVGGYECKESRGIQFRVCKDDGKLELTGELLCVAVTFSLKLKEDNDDTYIQDLYEKAHGRSPQALGHNGNLIGPQLEAVLGEGERNVDGKCEADRDCTCGGCAHYIWWVCTQVFVLFKYRFKYLFTTPVLPDVHGCHLSGHPEIFQIHADGEQGNAEVDSTDTASDEDSGGTQDHNTEDEISTDTDCDYQADEGNGDEGEEEEQAYAEEILDQAMSVHKETEIEQHDEEVVNDEFWNGASIHAGSEDEKPKMAMDIISISTDGSHGFSVRLPEAEAWDIMGMATFFPLQVLEDGRVIAGQHIKEGESLHACFVAPLHYDWMISSVQSAFLITDNLFIDPSNNSITASKIGILSATTTGRGLLRSVHVPSKTINKLVIN